MRDPERGEVWLLDLGFVAKIRPCLVLSVAVDPGERVLATVVPHTTSTRTTRFEAIVPVSFLKPGAFDSQQLVTVPQAKFLRRLGKLSVDELATVEEAVRRWLGL